MESVLRNLVAGAALAASIFATAEAATYSTGLPTDGVWRVASTTNRCYVTVTPAGQSVLSWFPKYPNANGYVVTDDPAVVATMSAQCALGNEIKYAIRGDGTFDFSSGR